MMKELSLFTGAGGGLLGTKLLGWEHIGYVEINDYCQQIIAQRIKDGILDNAPIFGDIRAFISDGYADAYQGMVDVITAGFPCQPYSTAAAGKNKKDYIVEHLFECVKRIQPSFIFCENVSRSAIGKAAEGLQELYYHTKAAKVSAADCGADHIRQRYWLFAYTDNEREFLRKINDEVGKLQNICPAIWSSYDKEPRVDYGMAGRMDQLKAIGNGQVPAVVATAWRLLTNI